MSFRPLLAMIFVTLMRCNHFARGRLRPVPHRVFAGCALLSGPCLAEPLRGLVGRCRVPPLRILPGLNPVPFRVDGHAQQRVKTKNRESALFYTTTDRHRPGVFQAVRF